MAIYVKNIYMNVHIRVFGHRGKYCDSGRMHHACTSVDDKCPFLCNWKCHMFNQQLEYVKSRKYGYQRKRCAKCMKVK